MEANYNIVVVFVIHWYESAIDLYVFPILIPPPTSLSTQSLWVSSFIYFFKWEFVLLGASLITVGKESACEAGDPSLILGSGRSTGEGIGHLLQYSWTSLVAWLVKNPPATWETWVQSGLGRSPGKGKATHSSILAWRIP